MNSDCLFPRNRERTFINAAKTEAMNQTVRPGGNSVRPFLQGLMGDGVLRAAAVFVVQRAESANSQCGYRAANSGCSPELFGRFIERARRRRAASAKLVRKPRQIQDLHIHDVAITGSTNLTNLLSITYKIIWTPSLRRKSTINRVNPVSFAYISRFGSRHLSRPSSITYDPLGVSSLVSQERESDLERKHLPAIAEYLGIHFAPIGSMKLTQLFRRKAKPLAAGTVEVITEIRSQEALLEAGALQHAIFNSANFSSIATDAKGVIQIFNVGAERMLGYAATDVMNKITPADISDPQELIARAKALSVEIGTTITPGFEALVFKATRGIEDIYELTYIRKDGSRFPAVVSVTALRDAQNVIIGYLLIGTDNTARKLAEEALLKAGALQSAIFNSANFSSIATDAKGVIQIFNVGAERMLGYAAADVMNKITPADISDPQEVIARAAALSVELATAITPGFEALVFKASRGIEDIYELTYIRKDGSRFPAVVSVTALRDAQDGIIGYLLIGTDNTARKRAEEALLKADALQSAIFNSANFSSIATDAKGVIQIFN